MVSDSHSQRKAQLDKAEREHLEDVVTAMRERVEDNVEFQLTQQGLDEEPEDREWADEDTQQLVEAIELEAVDGHTWEEAFQEYVTGVGYTIVNRLAALRTMEVRDFIDEEVTVFKDNGLTPAAETLVHEEFLLEDEAILEAYHNACDDLADEVEILFDPESPYSKISPDTDAFEALATRLDEIPDEVWRADDVLGWIYEYYNRPVVEALDAKNTLEPEDVGPANQFYTPHWVVRMLTDNSLGKLYLEATGKEDTVPEPKALSVEERKERETSPEAAPDVPSIATYLIPDDEDQDAPEFDDPSEIRVIDPACGSGHFLLYAFDILERIWWTERPDVPRNEIPGKILEHNLYGVDIDLRAAQLSAFNLYLKARSRAEAEGAEAFQMPNVGIVTADNRVAEIEEAKTVLDEITGEGTDLRDALNDIIETFQTTEALGSLLDVQGTLEEAFDASKTQSELTDYHDSAHQSLNSFLKALQRAVDERTSDSFGEQNLRSFLHLLVVLTQDYDVALMNPPYGAMGRMPDGVQEYVRENYQYTPQYYINFFEACDALVKPNGRTGMLVPRSFMFMKSYEAFREDFIGGQGSFDFLAEFGLGVLDNAVVRTAGTVIRSESQSDIAGTFFRLDDVETGRKEDSFLHSAFVDTVEEDIQRKYVREMSEFDAIPGKNLSYWVPKSIRDLYNSNTVLDAEQGGVDKKAMGSVKVGLQTGNNQRFVRKFWEHRRSNLWSPFAKGGADAWILPRVKLSVLWEESGAELRRTESSRPQNTSYYFSEGLTYTVAKTSGRRFGYLHDSSIFGVKGSVFIPDRAIWTALSYTNSHLFTYLMIAQTVERNWKRKQVAKIPWHDQLEQEDSLKEVSQSAVGKVISKRQYDFVSPHYVGPILLSVIGESQPLKIHREHPHRDLREELDIVEIADPLPKSTPMEELGIAAARHTERIQSALQTTASDIDEAVFDCFDLTQSQRNTVLQEIALRTTDNPWEEKRYSPDTITEPTDDFPEMVKDLLLHLTLRTVHEADDGIVPISNVEGEAGLLDHIEGEFERIWGERADARLAEIDQVVGSQTADEEAYPNLRQWLEEDLFEYHVSKFDRTPILWRFTTERLVSDPEGEGFACLVDYHKLDANVFDSFQNRYLEPRKGLLRERRSAANRRRSDGSLSASEQSEAAAEYARCESGLEQISVFEDRLADLAQTEPRDWPQKNQERATEAAEKVADFREQTAQRLETLDQLADLDDVDMEDLFSPSFYDTVQENREEWIDALDDLETAFEAYAEGGSEPVKAHLYDLFEYYEDLVGSSHYASNGILFMTYYFEKFEGAGQSEIGSGGISDRERLATELAKDLDDYEALAEDIVEACENIAGDISSEWADRALSEITTAGYKPNHKHGVKINITPLAEAEIVPKTVDEKVI